MEINEAQIEFAKRELQKCDSIPAVTGKLMNRTPEATEFSDLVAIANRAKMELEKEQEESDTSKQTDSDTRDGTDNSTSESTDSATTTGGNEPETSVSDASEDTDEESGATPEKYMQKHTVTAGGGTSGTSAESSASSTEESSSETDSPDSTDASTDDEDVDLALDRIADMSDDRGETSWEG